MGKIISKKQRKEIHTFFGDILKTRKKYWFHHLSSSYAFLETSRISHTYILFKNEEFFFLLYLQEIKKTNKKVLSVLVPYKHWTKKSNDFVREKQLCRKRKKILSIVQNENFVAKSIM